MLRQRTVDVLGSVILWWGCVIHLIGCLLSFLDHLQQMPVHNPTWTLGLITGHVSRSCQMSSEGQVLSRSKLLVEATGPNWVWKTPEVFDLFVLYQFSVAVVYADPCSVFISVTKARKYSSLLGSHVIRLAHQVIQELVSPSWSLFHLLSHFAV